MFGRFRKTNDPARETDGGAVAVDEPATSVATPTADPAARERRVAEMQATQAGDPDTRGLDRERVVEADRPAESDRFARTESAPVVERERAPVTDRAPVADREPVTDDDVADEPHTIPAVVAEDTVVAMRARQRDRFGGIRWGSAFFGLLSAIGLAATPARHRGRGRRRDRRVGDQRRDQGQRRHHRPRRRHPACSRSWRSRGTAAATSPGAWRASTAPARASACGCGRSSSAPCWPIAAVIGGNEYDVLQQLNLPNVAVGNESLTTTGFITLAAALVVTLRVRRASAARPATCSTAASTASLRATTSRPRSQRADQPRSIVSGTPVMVRPPGPRR